MSLSNPAYIEFMTNKPNPPEHAAYMARAAELYPSLPPGAQQAALHTLETWGKGYAKRYASNALARQSANERYIVGETLATWRGRLAAATKPYVYQGVRRDTPKRKREERERIERYNDYMLAGRIAEEQRRQEARKASERKLAAGLRAVGCDPREYQIAA